MTHDEALAALAELRTRAQAAVAAGDVAAGEEVALAAIWMQVEPEIPTTRALGLAFGALATELSGLVRAEVTIGGLNRAGHAFQHAPDSQFVDIVVTLNNLAGAHGRAGEGDKQAEMLTQIVRLAAAYTGEVDGTCTAIFIQLSKSLRERQQYAPALPLQAQILRYLLVADLADETRAAALRVHTEALREAGALDTLRADLDRVDAAFAARDDAALTRGLCGFERSHFLAAQGDWPGAAQLIDNALAAAGLPAREQTELLSLAARAWFKAGDWERAAQRSQYALRRRVGVA
jgi:tetratricopeptide (TPR) repeat protein